MKKALVLSAILLCIGQLVYSETIQVPSDYSSIQEAINNANEGDTVLVFEGRYYENIRFMGADIVLTSKYALNEDTSFISKTIIDGSRPNNPDSATCIYFEKGETASAVVQGFTITGGTGTIITSVGNNPFTFREGGAISIEESSPTIRCNAIIENFVTNTENIDRIAGGGAIRGRYCNATIVNNIIMNNEGFHNGGISLYWSSGTIKNNVIYNNLLSKEFGGAALLIENNMGPTIIENNTIVGNRTYQTSPAGGMYLLNGNIEAHNNIFWGNTQISTKEISGNGTFNMSHNNIEISRNNSGDVNEYANFEDSLLLLTTNSPLVDAGIEDIVYSDKGMNNQAYQPSKGTLRNDIGAYGGPDGNWLPPFTHSDIFISSLLYFGNSNVEETTEKILIIRNLSTQTIVIDSIKLKDLPNTMSFSFNNGTALQPMEKVEVLFTWMPMDTDTLDGAIQIFHSLNRANTPTEVTVRGTAKENTTSIMGGINQFSEEPFPNPVHNVLYVPLQLYSAENVAIQVFDISGSTILSYIKSYQEGLHFIPIPCNKLVSGSYHITVSAPNLMISKSFVVKE